MARYVGSAKTDLSVAIAVAKLQGLPITALEFFDETPGFRLIIGLPEVKPALPKAEPNPWDAVGPIPQSTRVRARPKTVADLLTDPVRKPLDGPLCEIPPPRFGCRLGVLQTGEHPDHVGEIQR